MKRILILSRYSMFSLGIETLLAQEAGIEVVNRGQDMDLNATLGCILTNRPDVVIVNCNDLEPELLPVIQCILRDLPEIRVIGLSLQNNQISIFQGEKKQVLEVDDLLEAIQD